MPHIILEHNVDNEELVSTLYKSLHKTLSEQETIRPQAIKTRSIKVKDVIVGDGADALFAHVQLKLLPGRSEDLKLKMSQALLSTMKEALGAGALSVEVIELLSYAKP